MLVILGTWVLEKKYSVYNIVCERFLHFIPSPHTQMRDHLVCEVMEGIGGVGGVRCGLIGEVGCSHPLTHHETCSLQAAAAAQQMTGEYFCSLFKVDLYVWGSI